MTKPRSNRLGMYADVRAILDEALRAGGGRYTLETHGEAVHWRQRAYRFRKLYAETLGLSKESPYDRVLLRRVDPDSSTVLIELREITGRFTPAEEPAAPLADDDLMDFASSLAAKLEKGNE